MKKSEDRRHQILSHLRAVQQEWKINELAKVMRVSSLTIRRDLDVLAASGTILRTIGGCLAVSRVSNAAYQRRIAANFEKKAAIGHAAAKEIHKGDAVIINDGSTTFHLATCLGQCGAVTVYTNSVAMIGEFSRFSNIKLCILGGEYHPDMFFLCGSLMERVLETIDADIVFTGADAIDSSGRCLAIDHDTARAAQLMLRCGRRKILLADDSKLSAHAQVAFASLRDFDLWITTPGIPRAFIRKFQKHALIREVRP